MESVRLGIDVGGTFIDCILTDDRDGTVEILKVPSERDTGAAVLDGISSLLEAANREAHEVAHLGHGTTIATNTVISGTGETVGVLTTKGFRDVLLLGRVRFPEPTNLNGDLPAHLVKREHILEIDERVAASGEVVQSMDVAEVGLRVEQLLAAGVRAVAICFLHAHRAPEHELQAKAFIEEHFPEVFVTCSSEVHAKPREYERFLATVMNAATGFRVASYLQKVSDGVADLGVKPALLVTRSNGGIMSAETAGRLPVHTMLSGPAAGVIAAREFAGASGFTDVVTWDMGGTSLDVSILDGRVRHTENARIGQYPLFVPSLDVVSVGSGGGSIAWLDPAGLLHVGPKSAGADPGPVCYGRGGSEPTLTDAYVTLGIIDPARFAGSSLRLERGLAVAALEKLGAQMGVDAFRAAEAVLTVATEQMYAEFMPVLARYGVDLSAAALYPFGGAGPTHAFLFAQSVGFRRVVVPANPGLLCAWGSIIADVRYEAARAVGRRLDDLDAAGLNAVFGEMEAEAVQWLDDQAIEIEQVSVLRLAQARYHGQSFDLEVTLPSGELSASAIAERFVVAYEERYGYVDLNAPVELVSVACQAVGTTRKPKLQRIADKPARTDYPLREVFTGGRLQSIPAVNRADLGPRDTLSGPVVIEQSDTTIYIPSGFDVRIDEFGNVIGEAK